jgi:hypothetical protein
MNRNTQHWQIQVANDILDAMVRMFSCRFSNRSMKELALIRIYRIAAYADLNQFHNLDKPEKLFTHDFLKNFCQ